MTGIQLDNAEIGTVSSRQDGSVAFRVITAELRPSEAGTVLQFHGKACKVIIMPHEGAPDALVSVTTERVSKSPCQRLHSVLFLCWKKRGEGDFDTYYRNTMERILDHLKKELDTQ